MTRLNSFFATLFVALILSSCGESPAPATETSAAETLTEKPVNADSIVSAIDQLRNSTEAALGTPVEIPTTELREKIRQKWSKIHFYSASGQVVRIKTYPHESISKRTEEFYFENGKLVLALIEDDGSAPRTEERAQKMYYYYDGKLVREAGDAEEGEYTIKESDAEELMQEAREYLDILAKQSK